MHILKNIHYFILCFALLIIAILLQFKFEVYTQPYFWDELGVYAPASIHLYEHGIGILPAHLPDVLSRGHPTLFVFIIAIAFKIFGCTPLVAHITCYFIYAVGMVFLFKILKEYLKPNLALLSALAIGIQPCFLSQSIIVLPEICLMTLALASYYYFIKNKLIACSLFLCLSVLVKESALILPLAFFLSSIIMNKKITLKLLLSLFIIPYVLFGVFLCIQKVQNGYFLYPLHTGLIKFELYYIMERWHFLKSFLFVEQGRICVSLAFLAMILFYCIKYNKILFTLLKANKRVFISLLILIIGGILFSIINYFLERYTIYYLVFIFILVFVLLNIFEKERSYYLNYFFSVGLIIYSFINVLSQYSKYTDIDFSYVSFVKNSSKTYAYLALSKFDTIQVAMDFPLLPCSFHHQLGYPKIKNYPLQIKDKINPSASYYIFSEPGNYWKFNTYDTSKLELDTMFKNSYSFVKIYKVLK